MNTPGSKNRRIKLALIAGVSAAIAATAVITAADAAAAPDNYIALSYSAVDQAWGWGTHGDANTAVARSLHECSIHGDQCVYVALQNNGCVAVAAFEDEYAIGQGATRHDAVQQAAHGLARSRVLYAGCA